MLDIAVSNMSFECPINVLSQLW